MSCCLSSSSVVSFLICISKEYASFKISFASFSRMITLITRKMDMAIIKDVKIMTACFLSLNIFCNAIEYVPPLSRLRLFLLPILMVYRSASTGEQSPAIFAGFLQPIKFVKSAKHPAIRNTHIFTATTSLAENAGFTTCSSCGIIIFAVKTAAIKPIGIPITAFQIAC